MRLWNFLEYLSVYDYIDFAARILIAAACGALIGNEREKRYKNAGIRTHIIVAIASALMMIVSKYGFFDVVGIEGLRLQADVSRIAHGVVSAIGFLGAGVIFVKRESIVGLTTAAGLWATVGIGITVGAGLYGIGIFSTVLILVIQKLLHTYHTRTHNKFVGTVKCNITKHDMTMVQLKEYINSLNFSVKEVSFEKIDDDTFVSMNIEFPTDETMESVLEKFHKDGILDSVDVYPVF